MTTTLKRRGPLDTNWWFGYLCFDNYEDVATRLRNMLKGKFYTFVSVRGDGRPEVRTSQRIKDIRKDFNVIREVSEHSPHGEWVDIIVSDGRYVWGNSTHCATENEARREYVSNKHGVYVVFEHDYRGDQVTFSKYNGYGELLQWVVSVEDHSR